MGRGTAAWAAGLAAALLGRPEHLVWSFFINPIVDLATTHAGASRAAAVSTHSRGRPWPRAARTRSLTHLLACHVPDREPFFLQTPVDLNVPSAWRGVRLLGHEHIRFP